MKISIIAVGKIKEKYIKDGIEEYSKRLSRFCTLEIIEVNDEKAPETLSLLQEENVKSKEAERVIKKIKKGSKVIVLDIKGDKMDSKVFSEKLESFFILGSSHITFIIGGSLGMSRELISLADHRYSFSDLTFPHQLIRLILLEQIYRAFKIINKETYHK